MAYQPERNPYILNKAFLHFVYASILMSAIVQISNTVDGIVVSHFVSPEAFASVALYTPLGLTVNALLNLVSGGAAILAARAMGHRDYRTVNGIFSTVLTTIVMAGVVFAVLGFVLGGQLTYLLTHNETLYPGLHSYLKVMLGCTFFPWMLFFFSQVMSVMGHPMRVTVTSLVCAGVNIILDLVFVWGLGLGVEGSAIASIVAYLIGALILGYHLLWSSSGIRISLLPKSYKDYLKKNLEQGVSLMTKSLMIMPLYFIANHIVVARLGHEGMFVMAICSNIMALGALVTGGFSRTILSMGSFMYSQYDLTGFRMLVNRCISGILLMTVLFTLLVEVAPDLITALFGAKEEGHVAMANEGLRIFMPFIIAFCLIQLMANLYQALGLLTLSPLVVLQLPVVLAVMMTVFSTSSNDNLLWLSFPVTGVLVLVITYVLSEIERRRLNPKQVEVFTLLPVRSDRPSFYTSLRNTVVTFQDAISHLDEILEPFQLPEEIREQTYTCTRAALQHAILHSGIEGNGHYTDLYMVRTKKQMLVTMKYEGMAFNPTEVRENEDYKLLPVLERMKDHIEYRYMYGQNILYVAFNL